MEEGAACFRLSQGHAPNRLDEAESVMMNDWALEHSVDALQAVRQGAAGMDASFDCVIEVEQRTLDRSPTSLAEASALLRLALADLEVGGRSDGRDLGAVQRVADYLLALDRASEAG